MRICLVLYDPQEFGGLEEYAVTLAIGLLRRGHPTSVLSATWAPPDNQYLRRLREGGVTIAQPPRWLSQPASYWPTKERILNRVLRLASPLVLVLAGLVSIVRRRSWAQSRASARSWLRGWLTRVVVGPDWRPPMARVLLGWWRLRWRPDLVHIQGYATTLLFAIDWAHANGVPAVYEEHQTPDAQFDWWRGFQATINKATVVVAVSEESARALRAVCGVTRPVVVRSPLLPDPATSGWQRDQRPHRADEPVRVTTVARLYVTKGLEYLLEAAAQVSASHPATQFRVYGDGALREELLAHAGRLGLDGDAIFVGPFTSRADLARIMAETDIFVMSSILEGQPLGLVEAMAYGCPIVATVVGGIPELIEDGVNGLLCAPRDPGCLARKIRLLVEDLGLRERLGLAARRSYERGPYQPESVCGHFIAIYDNVLREASTRPAA